MNHGRKSFPLFSFLLAGAFLFSATAFAGPEAQADPGKAKQTENDLKKGGTGGNAAGSIPRRRDRRWKGTTMRR